MTLPRLDCSDCDGRGYTRSVPRNNKCLTCDGTGIAQRFLTPAPNVIDPGAEPSKVGDSKLEPLIEWVERHPDCTLRSGEGAVLVKEIKRLRETYGDLDERQAVSRERLVELRERLDVRGLVGAAGGLLAASDAQRKAAESLEGARVPSPTSRDVMP